MHNPSLLLGKKGDLIKLAQEKVHEDGYKYKKGKSRSKRHSQADGDPQPKRPKLGSVARQERMSDLKDLISDIDRTIGFKQRRIETASATRNFKTCDELSQEILSLKSERREYTAELAALQKKATKSSWYFKNKEPQPTIEGQAILMVSSNDDEQPESNTVSIEQSDIKQIWSNLVTMDHLFT